MNKKEKIIKGKVIKMNSQCYTCGDTNNVGDGYDNICEDCYYQLKDSFLENHDDEFNKYIDEIIKKEGNRGIV